MSRCTFCPNASPVVPPTLNQREGRSDLLIIGEGPGKEEVRVGKGFQGPSGMLLKQALEAAGFDARVIASLTNATLCLPPKEGMSKSMCDACRPRLMEEIEAVNPRVILALGRWACQSLLGQPVKITAINGLPREWSGRWLVPSIHPASVLRHGNEMSALQTAVDVAMRLVRGEEGTVEGPADTWHWVADTEQKVEHMRLQMAGLERGWLLGCDIETTGLNPRSDRIVALGISYDQGRVLIIPGELVSSEPARSLLTLPKCRYAWHNGQFDVGFLRAKGIQARIDEDTLLQHYALNEQKGTHGLQQVAAAYLGARNYKEEVSAYRTGDWSACPPEVLHRYLARDCDYTRQLVGVLGAELAGDPALEGLYRGLLLPAAELLTEVSANGFYFSLAEADRIKADLEPRREAAFARLQTLVIPWLGDDGLNPASGPQVYRLIYELMRLRQPARFDRNTQEATLKAIAAGDIPPQAREVIETLLAWRDASKALSTSVEGLSKRVDPTTGRVHSSYLIHATVTGRLSSRDPNLQNVPSEMRGMFQAPEGRVLLETDLDQAELRVLANLSGDEAFSAIYREGKSLHKEVATALYGPDYNAEQYRQAKAYSFGLAYGRGAESLVREFGSPMIPKEQRLTLSEARERIDLWAARFPQAWEWLQEQKDRVRVGEVVVFRSPTGRLRRFKHITEANLTECENEASNFTIQATASDICLKTAIAVRPFVRQRNGLIVNLVHDSIIYELPDDAGTVRELALETAKLFALIGCSLVGYRVPITSEFKVGSRWGSLEKVSFND